MNETQVAELATLKANVGHILRSVDEIKDRLDSVATKEELAAMVTRAEFDALKRQVEDGSAESMFAKTTKIAAGIVVIAAALGVIAMLFKTWAKIA